MMLEILTLCRAQYSSICMNTCILSPRYKCATVAYSTRDWKDSLPWIVDIVSTRKRDTLPEITPKTRKAMVGLRVFSIILAEDLKHERKPSSLLEQKRDCPSSATRFGAFGRGDVLVVNPGPVMELINRAIPPQNPMIAGDSISPARGTSKLLGKYRRGDARGVYIHTRGFISQPYAWGGWRSGRSTSLFWIGKSSVAHRPVSFSPR
jgi:hypothetical protein